MNAGGGVGGGLALNSNALTFKGEVHSRMAIYFCYANKKFIQRYVIHHDMLFKDMLFFAVAFVFQNACLCSSILLKQSSKKYKKQGVSTIKIYLLNFRLSSLTSCIHYQLQDGGVQLSSFGNDFVGL